MLVLLMFAVAAVIVVTTKGLVMYLLDSILRPVTKQYSVGDYIEINGLRGRVAGINLLNMLMIQAGPHPLIDQLSGKTLSSPNSLLSSHYVRHDNILGPYAICTTEIPVSIHLDSDAVTPSLKQTLESLRTSCVSEIPRYLDTVQAEKLLITPVTQSCVTRVPHNSKIYSIIARYVLPVSERLEIQ